MNKSPFAPRRASRLDGFTLPEVLVATLVTGMIMAAIGSLMLQIRHVSKMAAQSTVATEMAQARMESMLDTDWTASTSGNDSQPPYTVLWSVSSQPPLSFRLDVTTRWHDLRNITHHVSLVSMVVTNLPPNYGLTPFNLPPIVE